MAGYLTTFTLLLLATQASYAHASSVSVISEGNASAKVNVENSFNSSSTTTNNNSTHTKVRIESNGEVKEYESANGDDVYMESSDGNSKVSIKNGDTKTPTTSVTPKPTTNEDHNATQEAENVKKEIEKNKVEQDNFFKQIEKAIRDFFKGIFG